MSKVKNNSFREELIKLALSDLLRNSFYWCWSERDLAEKAVKLADSVIAVMG